MAAETVTIETWLYTLLSGDATLTALLNGRVYGYAAPQQPVYPFILFQLQSGSNTAMIDGSNVLTRDLYAVRAVGKGSGMQALAAIANRIDALLAPAAAAQSGIQLRSARVSALSYAEFNEGIRYNHLGGIYRIYAAS